MRDGASFKLAKPRGRFALGLRGSSSRRIIMRVGLIPAQASGTRGELTQSGLALPNKSLAGSRSSRIFRMLTSAVSHRLASSSGRAASSACKRAGSRKRERERETSGDRIERRVS